MAAKTIFGNCPYPMELAEAIVAVILSIACVIARKER
jgi:hypothetical protein